MTAVVCKEALKRICATAPEPDLVLPSGVWLYETPGEDQFFKVIKETKSGYSVYNRIMATWVWIGHVKSHAQAYILIDNFLCGMTKT
jgi:hypothetical protein